MTADGTRAERRTCDLRANRFSRRWARNFWILWRAKLVIHNASLRHDLMNFELVAQGLPQPWDWPLGSHFGRLVAPKEIHRFSPASLELCAGRFGIDNSSSTGVLHGAPAGQ